MTLLERDRQNFEEGQLVGLEEGERVGLERGKLVGLAEGERVGLERGKLEVARSMKQKGLSDEIISEVTGLTTEQIELL